MKIVIDGYNKSIQKKDNQIVIGRQEYLKENFIQLEQNVFKKNIQKKSNKKYSKLSKKK